MLLLTCYSVMDNGRIAELDSPWVLLQDESSMFSQLVRDTGKESEAYLRRAAKEAAAAKQSKGT